MKLILIRIAIMLFLRWLRKNKNPNGLLSDIYAASGELGLIAAFEKKSAVDDIKDHSDIK